MSSWAASNFWLLWTMLIWTWAYKFMLQSLLSVLLGIFPEVGLLDYMVISFNFFRNCHTVFHRGCSILHFHIQCTNVPISPHLYQHLLFPVFFFFDSSHSNGMKWYPIVLSFISLMISDVEHLFMYLLAMCIFSLKKCLSSSFPNFNLVILGLLSCGSSSYILLINPLFKNF